MDTKLFNLMGNLLKWRFAYKGDRDGVKLGISDYSLYLYNKHYKDDFGRYDDNREFMGFYRGYDEISQIVSEKEFIDWSIIDDLTDEREIKIMSQLGELWEIIEEFEEYRFNTLSWSLEINHIDDEDVMNLYIFVDISDEPIIDGEKVKDVLKQYSWNLSKDNDLDVENVREGLRWLKRDEY